MEVDSILMDPPAQAPPCPPAAAEAALEPPHTPPTPAAAPVASPVSAPAPLPVASWSPAVAEEYVARAVADRALAEEYATQAVADAIHRVTPPPQEESAAVIAAVTSPLADVEPQSNPQSACNGHSADATSRVAAATPTVRRGTPTMRRARAPAASKATVAAAASQTEEEAGDAEQEELVASLRAQLVTVRLRCSRLETELDGSGAVMLAAFKRHQAQLQAQIERCTALAAHGVRTREWFAARMVASSTSLAVRTAWSAWRQDVQDAGAHVSARVAAEGRDSRLSELDRSATAFLEGSDGEEEANGGEKGAIDDAAPPVQPPPELPPPLSRRDLYRMSYEALIDQVLEMQENLYELADVPLPPHLDEAPATASPSSMRSTSPRRSSSSAPSGFDRTPRRFGSSPVPGGRGNAAFISARASAPSARSSDE